MISKRGPVQESQLYCYSSEVEATTVPTCGQKNVKIEVEKCCSREVENWLTIGLWLRSRC